MSPRRRRKAELLQNTKSGRRPVHCVLRYAGVMSNLERAGAAITALQNLPIKAWLAFLAETGDDSYQVMSNSKVSFSAVGQ